MLLKMVFIHYNLLIKYMQLIICSIYNFDNKFVYIIIVKEGTSLEMIIKRTNSTQINNDKQMKQQAQQKPQHPMSQKASQKSSISNSQKRFSIHFTRQLQVNSKKMQMEAPIGMQQILRSALRVFICKMCYNNVELKDTGSLGQCGHTFCITCLTQYCIYKIKVHQEVLCPQEGCQVKLTQNSQFFNMLPDQVKDKYKQGQLWKQTLDNPNVKLCQKQQCKGGLIDMLRMPPQCQKCGAKYCKQCMMTFHEGPCDQNFQDCFRQWKRCPKCKIFIQKTEGCNHMTCRCQHQFCFVCLSDWEPSHYQCVDGLENRLFFSEVQSVSKVKAFFSLIGLILLLPILIVGLAIIWAVGACFAILGGLLVSPCFLGKQIKDCCCCCIFFLILLPIAMAIAVIASPIAFTITIWKPFAYRTIVQHCNSISFLVDQLNSRQRRRN